MTEHTVAALPVDQPARSTLNLKAGGACASAGAVIFAEVPVGTGPLSRWLPAEPCGQRGDLGDPFAGSRAGSREHVPTEFGQNVANRPPVSAGCHQPGTTEGGGVGGG